MKGVTALPQVRRGSPTTERIRHWSRVDDNGCWVWQGRPRWDGYGNMVMAEGGRKRTKRAHRVSYEVFVGPIPEGMTVDHLCFVKLCVNPDHLRLLTHLENSRNQRRKTHCVHGHEYTPENTGWQPDRHNPANDRLHRFCLTCYPRWKSQR